MEKTAKMAPLIVAIALFCVAGHPKAQKSPPPEAAALGMGLAPAPAGKDCLSSLLNMSDCLSYVEVGSNQTTPDKACCPELAGLVESSPKCLCYLLGGVSTKQYRIKLDKKKALQLPPACGVSTPPPSSCSVLGIPVAAPSDTPGEQPQEGLADNTGTKDNGNGTLPVASSAMTSLYGLIISVLVIAFF